MITKQEILDFSQLYGLRPEVIEKDYILGWILAGIYHAKSDTLHWIFKGGTSLKKCYFETYRFSEDLDFTFTPGYVCTVKTLTDVLKKVASYVYEACGVVIPVESVEIKNNPRGDRTFVGKIGYIGPLSKQQGGTYKIKFDFCGDEALVLQPVTREVVHPYSDRDSAEFKASCYAYEEVFAEKVRALSERLRPRDLYDVIHLFRHRDLLVSKKTLLKTLEAKCQFKKIPVPTFEQLMGHAKKDELDAEWDNMLRHQLPLLPISDLFWQELPLFFEWLVSVDEAFPVLDVFQGGKDEVSWIPQINRSSPVFFGYIPKIQFAAANRLCIQLTYHQEVRTLEPYSFRKSKVGQVLFYGYELESGQVKCFKIEKFQKVELTQRMYVPRYRVEISAVGNVSTLPVALNQKDFSKVRRSGVFYVYECTSCGKRFKRSKPNSKLGSHKNSIGSACYGRYGVLQRM